MRSIDKSSKKVFSVIIPFYNEENICRNYKILSKCLKAKIPSYELIFVSDGSRRNIVKSLEELIKKDPNVKLISYPVNRGRGYAVVQGFKNASGDYLAYIDADLEISPKYLIPLYEKLKKYDVVVANKFHRDSKVTSPLMRKISSRLFNAVVKIGLGSKIKDHQVGLKGFRREAIIEILPRIAEEGWLFDPELLYLLQKKQCSIADIPISITYGFKAVRSSFVFDFLKTFVIISTIRKRHKDIK